MSFVLHGKPTSSAISMPGASCNKGATSCEDVICRDKTTPGMERNVFMLLAPKSYSIRGGFSAADLCNNVGHGQAHA